MPDKPLRPCRHAGCRALVRGGYCDAHRRDAHAYDLQRPSPAKRGYGRRWQAARAMYLREHPFCAMDCEREGRVTAATEVDHIIPHRGDYELFWDRKNWQSACKPCHSRKTEAEDGAFQRAADRIDERTHRDGGRGGRKPTA